MDRGWKEEWETRGDNGGNGSGGGRSSSSSSSSSGGGGDDKRMNERTSSAAWADAAGTDDAWRPTTSRGSARPTRRLRPMVCVKASMLLSCALCQLPCWRWRRGVDCATQQISSPPRVVVFLLLYRQRWVSYVSVVDSGVILCRVVGGLRSLQRNKTRARR
jgi:hypothetical protein